MDRRIPAAALILSGIAVALVVTVSAQVNRANDAALARLRNLGAAFYENPATTQEAVDSFRKALALAPGSVREIVNYGLALLRAGRHAEAIAQLERAQKLDPAIPHTWFNLGLAYRDRGEFDRALAQFREMARLVPNEPAARYQAGAILEIQGDLPAAIREFEVARALDPRLAAPHFRLSEVLRRVGRAQLAAEEYRLFQDRKKRQEGAAVSEDLDWCAYAEIYDPRGAPTPSAPPQRYRSDRLADGFAGAASGLAILAALGGKPDLIAWTGGRAMLFRSGVRRASGAGLDELRDVVSLAPGDVDNDGLPDLCVLTANGAALYRNAGGRFRKAADLAAGSFRSAVFLDYDHDYDPDLFLLGDESRLLRNNGQAGFSDETKRFPFVAGRVLDAKRVFQGPDAPGFDLMVRHEGGRHTIYRDHLGGSYEAVRPNHADAPATPVAADFRGNGRLDRAVIERDGSLRLLRDATPNYGNWIEVAPEGVKNPKIPLGARIEVRAGGFYEIQPYEGFPVVFRLGAVERVDTVRITWPNGLIQNEIDGPVNRILSIREAPRLAGSCPMIFTWNGKSFEFITDVLGVAPLGASSGDGQYFPLDHDEYVSIPGEALRARDGGFDIRITEELREVSYIDQVKLMALDHPADIEVVTNEKFKSPPFPGFRLFGANRRMYPVSAHDGRGTDFLPKVLRRDRAYPDSFRRDNSGTAEMHVLDLDFGAAAPGNRAALVLHGWVDWADGSTFLAQTSAGRQLVFPYLQVKDSSGEWKTVVADMGIPAGKPKTMAVDMAALFPTTSRELRIVTNLCVYWDEIYLLEDNSPPPARLTAVELASADLRFRGFSKAVIDPERKQPERFLYDSVSASSMWNPTPGKYTRYGSVETLLSAADDRMAIFGSGDELALRFQEQMLPALPAGWKRDFLLFVDGWAKDADANTAFSQSVLPLPFHRMSSYPYPASQVFPDDPAHTAYRHAYNTRPALRLIRPLRESR